MATGMPNHEGSPLEVSVNDYGIVFPPPPLPCRGEECSITEYDGGCQTERHHLHIGEPIYDNYGPLASDFRDLRSLTVWMPACIHNELHDENQFSVSPPEEDVMERAIQEDLILKAIGQNFSYIRGVRAEMALSGHTRTTRRKLDYSYKNFSSWHEALLERVDEIEVIPAQLVTGFLLIAAPKLARYRVMNKTGYGLTASSKDFRPEIFEPIQDFTMGGILHEGQVVRLRPDVVPYETQTVPKRLQAASSGQRRSAAPAAAAA